MMKVVRANRAWILLTDFSGMRKVVKAKAACIQ